MSDYYLLILHYSASSGALGQVEAKELINRVSRLLSRQYKESITVDKRSSWTLRAAIIGVILTSIVIGLTIIALFSTSDHISNVDNGNQHNLTQNNPRNFFF